MENNIVVTQDMIDLFTATTREAYKAYGDDEERVHGVMDSKRRYHTTWMILCEKCHNASMSNSAYYSFGEDGVLSPYDEKDGRQEIISRWNSRYRED